MDKFILGIDTTFHTSALSLVDKNGKVKLNKKIITDFETEDAKKFFNFHTKNILSLVRPVIKKYGQNIFLVSASSQEGAFHSLPVGAIVANTIGYLQDKKIVGVNHEIAHLYGNWLDRDQKKFSYPVLSLNISGAHSNLFLIDKNHKIKKVKEIVWSEDKTSFNGLGALFDVICQWLSIKIKKGDGGLVLEKLARFGQNKYSQTLNDFTMKTISNCLVFNNTTGIRRKIEEYKKNFRDKSVFTEFQKDFSAAVLARIFDLLVSAIAQIAKKAGAKEIHAAGGAAMNKLLQTKLENFCQTGNYVFKSPLKSEYCGDNAAMTAMAGYYKYRYSGGDKKFLTIEPSAWYYGYYLKNFIK